MSLKITQPTLTRGNVYDFVIIGSGFGGSVSAMRLTEKGYKVLVIEKGGQHKSDDFAESNWNLKKWLWAPSLGFRGIFKVTPFKHVNAMSGVGVGGGSLTYGATLPTPKTSFFNSGSWAGLQNWEQVLQPHYANALKMLGATSNPRFTDADHAIQTLAQNIGKEEEFHPSRVGIFFSEKDHGEKVKDPYFDGRGPDRKSCIECGGCMIGCRHDAKNSLDKNYLFFANQQGAEIVSDQEVYDVLPAGSITGEEGYFVSFSSSKPYQRKEEFVVRAKNVIFSGGVLGTLPLLMALKEKYSLPNLSPRLGDGIRTNNEMLTAVTSFDKDINFAQGITIGSILNTDEHSHLEPINFNEKSGIWRFIVAPRTDGANFLMRSLSLVKSFLSDPIRILKVLFSPNWGQKTLMLMFMQHLDSTIAFKRGQFGQLKSVVGNGEVPSSHIPEADALTREVESIVDGKASYSVSEVFTGAPTTGHILGGATIGANAREGVINDKGQVFGYKGLYVVDGSAVSANPGVNPSLSITAISEWFMSHIQPKQTTKPSVSKTSRTRKKRTRPSQRKETVNS